MKKYKLQELIADGRLDISKLDADSQAQINDIKILTDNWTLENDTARESDDLLVQFLEIEGKITKKENPPSPPPAPKPDSKPTKPPKEKSAPKPAPAPKSFETKVIKLNPVKADNIIDDMVGKAFYFRGDKGHWIQAKLHDGYFANKKEKDKFRLEFYPIGGKEKFGMPLVSDIISLSDLEKLVAGEELAKYSLKKPSSLITDFDKAIMEIDLCREEAKAEKAAQAKDKMPDPPKTSKEIFEEKSISWGKNMIKLNKIQNSDDDNKRKKIDKIIERASNEISEVLFGSKAAGEQIITALKSAFD